MGIRRVQLAINTLALLGALGYYGNKCYKNQIKPPLSSHQVAPLRKGELLFGVFANDTTDGRHLACFEQNIGERSDLSVRYITIRDLVYALKSKKPLFPIKEARIMHERGGAIYIKLKLKPEDISGLISGRYDKHLTAFAKNIKEYAGPLMIGFDLNGIKDPRQLSRIFDHIRNKVGTANIRWVWHPAFGPPPDKHNLKWSSIELFQKEKDGRWPSFEEMIEPKLEAAKKHNLAIMLTVGSSAPDHIKIQFLKDAVRVANENERIKGIVIHNVSQIGSDSRIYSWRLSPEVAAALRKSLDIRDISFLSDIHGFPQSAPATTPPSWETTTRRFSHRRKSRVNRTLDFLGDLLRIKKHAIPTFDNHQTCQGIEGNYYTRYDLDGVIAARESIQFFKQKLSEFKGGPYESPIRMAIAQNYVTLAAFERDTVQRIKLTKEAIAYLEQPLNELRSLQKSGRKPDRYPIVRSYFDLRLQLVAEIARTGKTLEAKRELENVVRALGDIKVLLEQQISGYSLKGYQSRIDLLFGQAFENLKKFDKARKYYTKADRWATAEQALGKKGSSNWFLSWIGRRVNWLRLTWRGESKSKLRHTATLARLGRVRLLLTSGKRADAQKALNIIASTFHWEELGKEKGGFMDRGIHNLIHAMHAAMILSKGDLKKAKQIFQAEVPWPAIDGYEELIDNLQIKVKLASGRFDTWEIVLKSLLSPYVKISEERLNKKLSILREFTNI